MTAAWPATLPEFVQSGTRETLDAQVLESQMQGNLPARRRVRAQWRKFDASIMCSAAQLAAFETFYNTTLASGVLPFTWVHPRTRQSATFRFTGQAPALAPRGTNADGVFAIVSFKLVRIA